ncbi:MAG: hypothetical protein WC967_00560 [Balneolaceae bacterium]
MKNVTNRIFLSMLYFAIMMQIIGCNDHGCALKLDQSIVEIVDENDNPLSGVVLEIINTRTDKRLCETIEDMEAKERCEKNISEIAPGLYSIVSSTNVNIKEVKDGDILKVNGIYGDIPFTRKYKIELDSSQCHPKAGIIDRIVLTLNEEN